jgi:hypothetical protein
MAHVARVATTQGVRLPQLGFPRHLPRCQRDLGQRQPTPLFEPAKSKRQLPQGVSGWLTGSFRGPPQGVCGSPSDRRLCVSKLLLTHRGPTHRRPIKIPRRSPVCPATDSTSGGEKRQSDGTVGLEMNSSMASGSSPQSPTGRKPFEGLTAPVSNRLEPFKGCLDGGMALHFSRIASAIEELEL